MPEPYEPDARSHWQEQIVADSVALLNSVLLKHHPELIWDVGPPSKNEMEKLRQGFQKAPEQFFELLTIFDYTNTEFFSYINPIALDDLANACGKQFDFYAEFAPVDDGDEGWIADQHNCCRTDKRWRDDWLPFAEIDGDPIFLDMNPLENGIPGQVVSAHSDGWSLVIQGYSIAHWLNRIAENIELEPALARPWVFTPFPPPHGHAG